MISRLLGCRGARSFPGAQADFLSVASVVRDREFNFVAQLKFRIHALQRRRMTWFPSAIASSTEWGASMSDIISFLFEQSESLMETAQRCTDPKITSELVSIAETLDAKAEELKRLD
jgi:hypothetical protein